MNMIKYMKMAIQMLRRTLIVFLLCARHRIRGFKHVFTLFLVTTKRFATLPILNLSSMRPNNLSQLVSGKPF